MTVSIFEVYGTNTLFDINGKIVPTYVPPEDTYFKNRLAPGRTWQNVSYPASAYPMGTSVATGKANLISRINATSGRFGFIGWSQGALVCSAVYKELRSGSLTSRNADFVGGVMFGNPRRQAGRTFPGCPDPGGNGIDNGNLLTGTETRWWEFANPGDVITVNDFSTTAGKINVGLFNLVNQGLTINKSLIQDLLGNPSQTVRTQLKSLVGILRDLSTGPHTTYGSTTPLSGSGDTRSCTKIALDYINTWS